MAKQELKKISQAELDEILEQHFLWLQNTGQDGIRADLSFCDLEGLTFPDRVSLYKTNLKRANLKNARLVEANFAEADLEGANFESANLEYALFEGADLSGVNFFQANLSRAYLFRANLICANFQEARLIETILRGTNLAGVDFIGSNLEKANLSGAYGIDSCNFEGAYLRDTIFETRENDLEQKILRKEAEIAELKEKLTKGKILEQEVKDIKQKLENKEQELSKLIKLNNISQADESLSTALINTSKQIIENQNNAACCQNWALTLIFIDLLFIILMPIYFISQLNGLKIVLFTFPALLILIIALNLLRHQKQLIAEIRHYSMLKHKIELYGGILRAAQFIAFEQNSEEDKYIKETFNEIKAELLKSPNFDLNAQPHIFPEEGGHLVEMLKSITELLKISTEANKAIAESAKKAITSEKSNL